MIEVRRARDRLASPWKNGGGVTREVAVSPLQASMENFDWRISLADVEQAGPFSIFPGIDRKLAVLRGELSLVVQGHGHIVVSPETEAAQISGDAAVDATLTKGPVRDLNVMTRRSNWRSRLTRLLSPTKLRVGVHIDVFVAVGTATLTIAGRSHSLAALDALISDHGVSGEVLVEPESTPLFWIEIFAI